MARLAVALALALAALAALAPIGARGQEVEEDTFGAASFEDRLSSFKATPKLLCQACNVAVTEMWRANPKLREDVSKLSQFKRREREADIFGAIDAFFCAEGAAIRYVLDPVVYGRACKVFLERFNNDNEVETRLIAGAPGGHYFDLANSVCRDVCKDVPDLDRVPPDAPRDAPRAATQRGNRGGFKELKRGPPQDSQGAEL